MNNALYHQESCPVITIIHACKTVTLYFIHNAVTFGIPSISKSVYTWLQRQISGEDSHDLISSLHSLERLPSLHQPKRTVPCPA